MIWTWFVKSFYKTRDKVEWLVVPLIVILASVVGLLSAVFVGLAMSTLFFVQVLWDRLQLLYIIVVVVLLVRIPSFSIAHRSSSW